MSALSIADRDLDLDSFIAVVSRIVLPRYPFPSLSPSLLPFFLPRYASHTTTRKMIRPRDTVAAEARAALWRREVKGALARYRCAPGPPREGDRVSGETIIPPGGN